MVLQSSTAEIYVLLTNVTPINLVKILINNKKDKLVFLQVAGL